MATRKPAKSIFGAMRGLPPVLSTVLGSTQQPTEQELAESKKRHQERTVRQAASYLGKRPRLRSQKNPTLEAIVKLREEYFAKHGREHGWVTCVAKQLKMSPKLLSIKYRTLIGS